MVCNGTGEISDRDRLRMYNTTLRNLKSGLFEDTILNGRDYSYSPLLKLDRLRSNLQKVQIRAEVFVQITSGF